MSAKYSTLGRLAKQQRRVLAYGLAPGRCHVAAHASKREQASLAVEGKDITYRPRSVSSLLMRLRAMAAVCMCVGWYGRVSRLLR